MNPNESFRLLISQFNITRIQIDRIWNLNHEMFVNNYGEEIRAIMYENFGIRVHIFKGNPGKRLISIYLHCLQCRRSYKLMIHRADVRSLDTIEVSMYGNAEEICVCGNKNYFLFKFFPNLTMFIIHCLLFKVVV